MQLSKRKSDRPPLCITWDVVLFLALYIVSPSYLGVEFTGSLPVMTLSRLVLILMGVMLIWRRRKNLSLQEMNMLLTGNRLLRWGLVIYFGLLLLCDVALFPADKGESLKSIFVLLLEGYGIVWCMSLLLDTRKKLVAAIKVLVLSASVVSLIAIIGCIADFNPFHLLKTVRRHMLMSSYYRLGVLRASAGFGHPIYFGAFCAVILPLHMYIYENETTGRGTFLYGATLAVTAVALVLSNSRGSLVAVAALLLLSALHRILCKQFKKFLLHYLPVLGVWLLCLLALCFLLPHGRTLFPGIVESLLGINLMKGNFGSHQGGTPSSPQIPEYGENASGMQSRFAQLSGIRWTLDRKPLFGLGSNAHTRGLIRYEFRPGSWWPSHTFDMGIVAIFCQYGIVGLLGYAALYGSLFITTIRKKFRKDPLMAAFGLALITFFLCLLTISSLDSMFWVLAGLIVCLVNMAEQEISDH